LIESGDLDNATKELESVQKHKLVEKMSHWKEIEKIKHARAEEERIR